MNIDTALEKIYSLKQFHVKLGLENIKHLLNHLGNPEHNLKAIHVAGSNGKGSTCSFLASILQESGFKVGLYTSPHFVKFNERIKINGNEISDLKIIDFLDNNKSYIDEHKPTFFEITTALAFQYFVDEKVDYAIIETGLGGRLDATNTLKPIASVITSISLEHTHILGNELGEIAYEKAGIIKTEIPVFVSDIPEEAMNKIQDICTERRSKLFKLNSYVNISLQKISLKGKRDHQIYEKVGLKGEHQLKNAALAILTLNKVLNIKDSKLIQNGLDNVVLNTGIQGRYERFGDKANVIFDSAHNLEGLNIFIDEFKNEYHNYQRCSLIFGTMKDKKIKEMLNIANHYFSDIFVTSTNYERAATAEEIKNIADSINVKTKITILPENLVLEYLDKKSNECLVVLGSIYLVGQIKAKLN